MFLLLTIVKTAVCLLFLLAINVKVISSFLKDGSLLSNPFSKDRIFGTGYYAYYGGKYEDFVMEQWYQLFVLVLFSLKYSNGFHKIRLVMQVREGWMIFLLYCFSNKHRIFLGYFPIFTSD